MPLYTYTCTDHGQFSAWAQMSQSAEPQPCPHCAKEAQRALSTPAIGSRSAGSAGDTVDISASPGPSMGGCGCHGGICPH